MYMFSKQGELMEDMSMLKSIPGSMCSGSLIVQKHYIYAAGYNDEKCKTSHAVFDGKTWEWLE